MPIFGKPAPGVKVIVNTQGRGVEAYYPDYKKYSPQSLTFGTDLEYGRFIKIKLRLKATQRF